MNVFSDLMCSAVTLKSSNSNKDEHDPTCDHGESSQRTHGGEAVVTGTKGIDSRPDSRGTSGDLHSLITTSNTTTTTTTLTSTPTTTSSEQNKSWGREPLELWDKHTHVHTHMLGNRGRLENERGECYVTCEREEVVSKILRRGGKGEAIEGERMAQKKKKMEVEDQ